ncbi:MAG TPA: Gmad2 immunoglobulin-like domain-containing protein [Candidatus Paceibacterota bacterium]
MKAAKVLVVVLGVIIIVLLGVLFFYNPAKAPQLPPDNVDGAKIIQPIVSADGHLAVTSLVAGQIIASPVTVVGTVAGGGWFFEATFPVKILDGDGTMLGTGVAQAQSDWTSTSSVPFTAIVQFSGARAATGTVVLSRDNPSGAPQNDASLSIPIRFK